MMLIVMTAVSSPAEAESLAASIVDSKLAACVQILAPMTSIYNWNGNTQKEVEHLLMIKTLPDRWDALEALIVSNHSYDVPEILAIDAEKVAEPYFAWMRNALR